MNLQFLIEVKFSSKEEKTERHNREGKASYNKKCTQCRRTTHRRTDMHRVRLIKARRDDTTQFSLVFLLIPGSFSGAA